MGSPWPHLIKEYVNYFNIGQFAKTKRRNMHYAPNVSKSIQAGLKASDQGQYCHCRCVSAKHVGNILIVIGN